MGSDKGLVCRFYSMGLGPGCICMLLKRYDILVPNSGLPGQC